MRRSDWTPSIVPRGDDHCLPGGGRSGPAGPVWHEAAYETTDFETVVTDLLEGQYKNPVPAELGHS
jgi:hypothetical protein